MINVKKDKMKDKDKKIVWEFTNQRKLDAEEFRRYFEKKVLKQIRKYKIYGKLNGDNDIRKNILKNIYSKIYFKSNKKILVYNLNDASVDIIYEIMSENKLKNIIKKQEQSPLFLMSDKEIELYGKLNRIKGKITRKMNREKEKINDFIKEMETRDKDVRHAVVNSMMQI